MIDSFRGNFRFLSNFWPTNVYLADEPEVIYPTVEHAYQAAKCKYIKDRRRIADCKLPGDAKKIGKSVETFPDWGDHRRVVMLDLLRQKFSIEPLKSRLLETGDQNLVEGNTWGDNFWGICNGDGENHLGRLLMKVREELQD